MQQIVFFFSLGANDARVRRDPADVALVADLDPYDGYERLREIDVEGLLDLRVGCVYAN